MRIAIVGSTGLVGTEILKVIEESNLQVSELIPISSEKSVGKEIFFNGKLISVVNLSKGLASQPNIAIFSAGSDVSRDWAPRFAKQGCYVIDNSSAWRMDPSIKLVVPEINGDLLTQNDYIIANPNCSTIQLVMILGPLHQAAGLKRVVVSTYQAVTGTGQKAVKQLMDERQGITSEKVYPHPIDLNCLPHCDVFTENGYTKEEMKLVNETRKILGNNSLKITATSVRVPVIGGHSESVNVELQKPCSAADARKIFASTPGVVVVDEPSKGQYPMPIHSRGRNEVYVGRIREDFSVENGLNLWIVADNLRKGAATNAVQIAQIIVSKKWN